jgi:hypothetical protein
MRPWPPRSVLGRLDFLWRQLDPCRRLGAGTAFNSLYRVLREEKELVSVFLLQLMVAAVSSLGAGGQEQPALAEAAGMTLAHLQKILLHYRSLFLQEVEGRRVPGESGGGLYRVWASPGCSKCISSD